MLSPSPTPRIRATKRADRTSSGQTPASKRPFGGADERFVTPLDRVAGDKERADRDSLSSTARATSMSVSSQRYVVPGPAAAATWRPAAVAALAGLVAFVVGTSVEAAIIRAVHGNRSQLEWISDVVASVGVVALTYLWLHLKDSRMRLLALEREQVALNEQLRLAAEIQRSALPDIPPATPGFRWAARMIPAGRIGGDFYDFHQPTADVALVIVGDVSGKGIPAALLLSSVKTLFRTTVQDTTDPAALARRLSAALFEEHAGMPYVTAIVARFDSAPLRVTYVNAGHPSAYLLREGETRTLASGGPPLGLLPGVRYAAEEEELRPGDFGVLVTDGITEALETGPTTVGQAVRRARDNALTGWPLTAVCDDVLRVAAGGGGPAGVDGWQDDRTVFAFAVDGWRSPFVGPGREHRIADPSELRGIARYGTDDDRLGGAADEECTHTRGRGDRRGAPGGPAGLMPSAGGAHPRA